MNEILDDTNDSMMNHVPLMRRIRLHWLDRCWYFRSVGGTRERCEHGGLTRSTRQIGQWLCCVVEALLECKAYPALHACIYDSLE